MKPWAFAVLAFLAAAAPVLAAAPPPPPTLSPAASPPVTVAITDNGRDFTLSNGIITAHVRRADGNLTSLVYNGTETLGGNAGYWSHNARGNDVSSAITIDPAANNGERAEVSVKGLCHGQPMGAGSPGGGTVADIEIRYALERGLSGLYTYSIWQHTRDLPATNVGEARFCTKLNDDLFDWMTVDAKRNFQMFSAYDWNHGTTLNMKEVRLLNTGIMKGHIEHKYDYSANQFETLAWGWSSTTKHIGYWFVNPTIEYLSGGPTKIELSAHRDATFTDSLTAAAPPCLLNYWRGSHYGGASLVLAQGEVWSKVVGPFLIYCNSGGTPEALWKDALARSATESARWPYDWVQGVDYPHQHERGIVRGSLVLHDPQSGLTQFAHLRVGLAHPDYSPAGGRSGRGGGGGGGGPQVAWQNDAKYYQFWARGEPSGTFSIPNIRPGAYTLHAISDNILGEFAQANITVEAGKTLDLGAITWTPVRYGRQLWDIGIPDRTAGEFLHGPDYNQWGLYLQYARDFPNDVDFTIGKSDFHKDWNIMQVPHNENPADTDGKGNGRATTWTIHFNLPDAPATRARATLRLAFAGTEARSITVAVNNQPAGVVNGLMNTSVIHRDADRSYWQERDVSFAASLMHAGDNALTLAIPAGPLPNGIEYDYLRLELDDNPPDTR